MPHLRTPDRESATPRELTAERAARLARERAIIAKAEADLDAGLGIDDDDLEAWFDALDRDELAPPPRPKTLPRS